MATVGINNMTNAALLAARILAIYDVDIRRKVNAYAVDIQLENFQKKQTLAELGWDNYLDQMRKTR